MTSAQFFREQLASEVPGAAPLIVMQGVVTHEKDGRRASKVAVYGVDDRFFQFNGYSQPRRRNTDAQLTPALARELGAASGDTVSSASRKTLRDSARIDPGTQRGFGPDSSSDRVD